MGFLKRSQFLGALQIPLIPHNIWCSFSKQLYRIKYFRYSISDHQSRICRWKYSDGSSCIADSCDLFDTGFKYQVNANGRNSKVEIRLDGSADEDDEPYYAIILTGNVFSLFRVSLGIYWIVIVVVRSIQQFFLKINILIKSI